MTLLTSAPSNDDRAKLSKAQQRLQSAEILVFDIWLEAYKAGDIAFEALIKKLHHTLITVGVTEPQRHRLLGEVICAALEMPQPTRVSGGGKSHPVVTRKLAASLLKLIAKTEGLPKSRLAKGMTAYEKTSEFLKTLGFDVAPSTLIRWSSDFPDD